MQLQTNIDITKCSPNVDAHIFNKYFSITYFSINVNIALLKTFGHTMWTLLLLGQASFELMLCQMHPWDILNMNVTATFNRIKGRDPSS